MLEDTAQVLNSGADVRGADPRRVQGARRRHGEAPGRVGQLRAQSPKRDQALVRRHRPGGLPARGLGPARRCRAGRDRARAAGLPDGGPARSRVGHAARRAARPPRRLQAGPGRVRALHDRHGPPLQRPRGAPAVRMWSVWNEPNHPQFLQPLSERLGGKVDTQLAAHLPSPLRGGAGRARARPGTAGTDTVLFGEILPVGQRAPRRHQHLRPLLFLREFFCLDADYKPLRGRAASVRGCNPFPSDQDERLRLPPVHQAGGAARGARQPRRRHHRPDPAGRAGARPRSPRRAGCGAACPSTTPSSGSRPTRRTAWASARRSTTRRRSSTRPSTSRSPARA